MTIAQQIPRDGYIGDGVQDTFAFTFRILEDDDLFVAVDDILQVQSVDYTIQNQVPDGGDVVFEAGSIPGDTLTVRLFRQTDRDQETVYTPFDPFPAKSHEGALDKLTMISQESVTQEDIEANFLRLDATNGPLIGTLGTQNVTPDSPDVRDLGAEDNRYIRVFGDVGVFVNSDQPAVDVIVTPSNTEVGGFLAGTQSGAGETKHILGDYAATAIGNVRAVAGSYAAIEAESSGATAFGYSACGDAGGRATVRSTGQGSFASGYCYSYDSTQINIEAKGFGGFVNGMIVGFNGNLVSTVEAGASGSFVSGMIFAYDNSDTSIRSTEFAGYGSMAGGHIAKYGSGSANIVSNNLGAMAFGSTRSVTPASTELINASGRGSFAQGYAADNETIEASGYGSAQFGPGINAIDNSLQVGSNGARLEGDTGHSFGSIGVFLNTNQPTINIAFPSYTDSGGIIAGSQIGPGTLLHSLDPNTGFSGGQLAIGYVGGAGTASIEAIENGAFALGRASAAAGGVSRVLSDGFGSFVVGYTYSIGGNTALVEAGGFGGVAMGHAGALGGNATVRAPTSGAFASGMARGTVGGDAIIEAGSYGSMASGYIWSPNGQATIRTSQSGAFALGRAYGSATPGDTLIEASGRGAFALGNALNAESILANADGCMQFAPGINDVINSIHVGVGIRLHGLDGLPAVVADGDIWLNAGDVFIRSGGVNVQIT